MVHMTVLPLWASFFSNCTILSAVELSSPLVGSSSRMTTGSVISSYPIEVLFLSPPEIPFSMTPPILVSAHCYRPSLSMISSTLLGISKSVSPVRSLAAKVNDSRGVMVSIKMSSCCTNAPSFPKSLLSIALLLNRTSPFKIEPGLSASL